MSTGGLVRIFYLSILGFYVTHKCHWGSTPNRYTVIGEMVELLSGSKYVQFREICSLQYSIIINTFWADPHSDLLPNAQVKPKNMIAPAGCAKGEQRYPSGSDFLTAEERHKKQ